MSEVKPVAIFTDILCFKRYSMSSGQSDRRQKSQVNNLSDFPQEIPQYVEVPPNSEAKRIISYFSAVLSC